MQPNLSDTRFNHFTKGWGEREQSGKRIKVNETGQRIKAEGSGQGSKPDRVTSWTDIKSPSGESDNPSKSPSKRSNPFVEMMKRKFMKKWGLETEEEQKAAMLRQDLEIYNKMASRKDDVYAKEFWNKYIVSYGYQPLEGDQQKLATISLENAIKMSKTSETAATKYLANATKNNPFLKSFEGFSFPTKTDKDDWGTTSDARTGQVLKTYMPGLLEVVNEPDPQKQRELAAKYIIPIGGTKAPKITDRKTPGEGGKPFYVDESGKNTGVEAYVDPGKARGSTKVGSVKERILEKFRTGGPQSLTPEEKYTWEIIQNNGEQVATETLRLLNNNDTYSRINEKDDPDGSIRASIRDATYQAVVDLYNRGGPDTQNTSTGTSEEDPRVLQDQQGSLDGNMMPDNGAVAQVPAGSAVDAPSSAPREETAPSAQAQDQGQTIQDIVSAGGRTVTKDGITYVFDVNGNYAGKTK